MTHDDLCQLGQKWLKRPHSQKGPGCKIAVTEIQSGFNGEVPDVIGWRRAGNLDCTVVIEAKTSRSDFLADQAKPHRQLNVNGLGNLRFYLCPSQIINADEVPPGWGLLWATPKGQIRSVINPFSDTHMIRRRNHFNALWHESNTERELFILVRLFDRTEDPEKINQLLREASRDRNRLARRNDQIAEERDSLKHRLMEMRFKYEDTLAQLEQCQRERDEALALLPKHGAETHSSK